MLAGLFSIRLPKIGSERWSHGKRCGSQIPKHHRSISLKIPSPKTTTFGWFQYQRREILGGLGYRYGLTLSRKLEHIFTVCTAKSKACGLPIVRLGTRSGEPARIQCL